MDQVKIGRFISYCRKEKGMTQAQLAEQFGVSNAAVSKWENGKSCPDASIMIALCDFLGITVNELLSGEKISVADYREKAEHNLISVQSEKSDLKKKIRLFSRILYGIAAVLLVVWLLDKIPFSQKIDQTIYANIYQDGAEIRKTSVYMKGKRTHFLFRENCFVGEFRISFLEQTDVDGLQTKIQWRKNSNFQTIHHFYKGSPSLSDSRGVVSYMLISDDMTQFAIFTVQNEIIATSETLYRLCSDLIVYQDTGSAVVYDLAGKIELK